jgi:Lrp/AsnC family transcriptional regulator for asnA, asnC and gidA
MHEDETVLDKIDLKIINSLIGDCRSPYRNIAERVGITPNAVKTRVNKMISKGIIQNFVVRINPVIFGYEKECILTVRQYYKSMKEEKDIVEKLNLLGEVYVYAKQLGGDSIFVLAIKPGAEDKIGLMIDLLKPAIVDSKFVDYKPTSMSITNSDFKIIKCLLSNARMEIADIAKDASISSKTVARRIDKLREGRILEFSILRDMSSMQLVGFIEFAVVIHINKSFHQYILKRIYRELQEHLVFTPNENQSEVIFAVFFCANIPTVDSILTRIKSYDGVDHVGLFITTKLVYYHEWLKKEIDKSLKSKEATTARKSQILRKL